MQRLRSLFLSLLALGPLTLAACAPAASSAPPPGPTAAPAAVAPAAPPAPAVASPGAAAAESVNGTVQTLADGTLTLTSGQSFSVPTSVRVTRSMSSTAADLQPGDYVAITGTRQPDNTLLATMVNVFPPSVGQVAPGQRPLPQGNLMTNATISQIDGGAFTVTFPGGGARVQLAPDASITRQVDASLSDVQQGATVNAQVVGDVARTVTIIGSTTPTG